MAITASSHLLFGHLLAPSKALQVAERIKDSDCELLAVDEQRSAYALFHKASHISVQINETLELSSFPIYDTAMQKNWSDQLTELLQDQDADRAAASWLLMPLFDQQ